MKKSEKIIPITKRECSPKATIEKRFQDTASSLLEEAFKKPNEASKAKTKEHITDKWPRFPTV